MLVGGWYGAGRLSFGLSLSGWLCCRRKINWEVSVWKADSQEDLLVGGRGIEENCHITLGKGENPLKCVAGERVSRSQLQSGPNQACGWIGRWASSWCLLLPRSSVFQQLQAAQGCPDKPQSRLWRECPSSCSPGTLSRLHPHHSCSHLLESSHPLRPLSDDSSSME